MNTLSKTLIIAGLAASSLAANAKVSQGQKFGDWEGACQSNECAVTQMVKNKEGKPLAQIVLGKVKQDNNTPTFFITVPLGVSLPQGMLLSVDGQKLGVAPYLYCTTQGCLSVVSLKGKALQKIKAGAKLQIATFFGGKQQTINFSLSGVTAAINAL